MLVHVDCGIRPAELLSSSSSSRRVPFSGVSVYLCPTLSLLLWPHSTSPTPPADLNPLWMAAGAVFTLAGEGSGQRSVAASDFFLGYRKVDMQPHEILLKVWSSAVGCLANAD